MLKARLITENLDFQQRDIALKGNITLLMELCISGYRKLCTGSYRKLCSLIYR